MRSCFVAGVWFFLIVPQITFLAQDEKIRVEHSKRLPRGKGLATQAYRLTEVEKEQTKDWKKAELESGSPEIVTLRSNNNARVSWFGIVRDIDEDKEKNETRLLVEMKYFDGLTDTHLQVVSIFGAGDFRAIIPETGHKLKTLSLVRVYGTVAKAEDVVPQVAADYVRVWDWGLFTFMPYGKDKSDSKWVQLRKVDPDDSYSSAPNREYYENLLGKR